MKYPLTIKNRGMWNVKQKSTTGSGTPNPALCPTITQTIANAFAMSIEATRAMPIPHLSFERRMTTPAHRGIP